tara:strand:- start:214 stop:345 length:132 start_codon:yes stop_codon:yes gene_type:complete
MRASEKTEKPKKETFYKNPLKSHIHKNPKTETFLEKQTNFLFG